MKKLLSVFGLLLLLTSIASAQCSGIFPSNTLCGNLTGSPNTPRPSPVGSFPTTTLITQEILFSPISGSSYNAEWTQVLNVLELLPQSGSIISSYNFNYVADPTLTGPGSGAYFNMNASSLFSSSAAWRVGPFGSAGTFWEGATFIADLPVGSTAWQTNGVASYCTSEAVVNVTPDTGGGDCVSFFAAAAAGGVSSGGINTGGGVWGMNTAVFDDQVFNGSGYSSTPGRTISGTENDMYTFHSDTVVAGFSTVNSRYKAESTGLSFAFWLQKNPANSLTGFTYAFRSDSGAATYGLSLGATAASGTSISSQYVLLSYFNASAAAANMVLQAVPSSTNVGLMISTSSGNAFLGINGSAGVTCATGSPTSSFAAVGGIVTHC